MERIKHDLESRFKGVQKNLFRKAMMFIATGRNGMTEEDIRTLLGDWTQIEKDAPYAEKRKKAQDLRLSEYHWGEIRRSVRAYLFQNGEEWDFFHQKLKEAVGRRYLATESIRSDTHKMIADYLERMGFEHLTTVKDLPHHLIKTVEKKPADTPDCGRIENVLCDIFFVEAKVKAGLVHTLQEDYKEALKGMPDGENRVFVDNFAALFLRQRHILAAYPKLTFQQLYNELQWKKGQFKVIAEKARTKFRKEGRKFICQYRKPKIEKSRLLATLSGHTSVVTSCTYSPNGQRILSGSWDNTLKIWNAETGQEITTLEHTGQPAFCKYSPDSQRIGVISINNTISILDAETGRNLFSLRSSGKGKGCCSFSPNSRRIVAGSTDNTLIILDAETGNEIIILFGHSNTVNSCAYSPDGHWIVSGSSDKTLKIWDAETGHEKSTLTGHIDSILSCSYSPDGRRIVSASMDILKIWDAKTGRETISLSSHDRIWDCAYSPNGCHIISGSQDNTVKIWDTETGHEIATLSGHCDSVTSCAYSPDGRRIVSGSRDQTIKIWDAENDREINILSAHSHHWACHCSYSPNGRRVVSGGGDNALKIWDAETGNEMTTLTGHSNWVWSCAFSPDGHRIISGSEDKTLKIWNAETGHEITTLTGHRDSVRSCVFSPDGRLILSGSFDLTLKIWDGETGYEIATLSGNRSGGRSCAYAPDGRSIVSNGIKNDIKIWNAEICQEITTLTGHSDSVSTCLYSPDGRRVVSGSQDKTIKIWDVETGHVITTLTGHIGNVNTCVFSADGRWIVSGSHDNTLKIWDAESGQELATFVCDSSVYSCAISGCGTKVVCGDEAGNLYFLKLEGFEQEPPILSSIRFWLPGSDGKYGSYSLEITANCPICGNRFTILPVVLDAIRGINSASHNTQDTLQYLNLSNNVWDDPKLFNKCPNCQEKLRFNPFVIDNSSLAVNNADLIRLMVRNSSNFNYKKAIQRLEKNPSNDITEKNAIAVCQLRLGNYDGAINILQGVIYYEHSIVMRDNVPLVHKINFATALLLKGNIGGCETMLSQLSEVTHPVIFNLHKSIMEWRKGLTLFEKIGVIKTNKKPKIDFTPGIMQ